MARPRIPRTLAEEIAVRRAAGDPWKVIAAALGIGERTAYRLLAERRAAAKGILAENSRVLADKTCCAGAPASPTLSLDTAAPRPTRDERRRTEASRAGDRDVTSLFSSPAKQAPLPPAAEPPSRDDAEVEEARRKQIQVARLAKGRGATVLTGPAGVTGAAPTSKPTALSGLAA